MIQTPFEDKVDLFSPLCSKYQWEYACNNTQRITLSASRCNRIHGDSFSFSPSSFDCPLSVFSSRCVLKWQCVLYMRMTSHSHMASNVLSDFYFYFYFFLFTWCEAFWGCCFSPWVLTRLCQRVLVFSRWSFKSVHVTLHLVWQTQEVSLTVK